VVRVPISFARSLHACQQILLNSSSPVHLRYQYTKVATRIKMDWKPYFHVSFDGGIFLFPFLRVNSWGSFLAASGMTIAVCWTERLVTQLLTKNWQPLPSRRMTRVNVALWRTGLYWVATLLRLIYMLVAMSFHVGLLLVTVTALAMGQFVIEYLNGPDIWHGSYGAVPALEESYGLTRSDSDSPLDAIHGLEDSDFPLQREPTNFRRHSRPSSLSLSIHPKASNFSRAEAAAERMGLMSDDDRQPTSRRHEEGKGELWESGSGAARARELMGE